MTGRIKLDAAEFALDALDHAIFFLGPDCSLIRANEAARDLLADVGGLAVRKGQLVAVDPRSMTVLCELMAATQDGVALGGTIAVRRAPPRRPLIARLLPYRKVEPGDRPRMLAILVVRDPDAELGSGLLDTAAAFRFTRTEALLACKFIEMSDLELAASALGMQPSTARTHIKRCMEKTETKKQSDLVRVLLVGRPPLR